jgi:GNAT superfamily N-acetyltransferase
MVHLTAFDSIDDAALKALESGLNQDAAEKNAPAYLENPLSILAHDANNVLIGGLTGKTVWDWLYIDTLWVKKDTRTKGIGRDLVKQAEAVALKRSCHSAYL